MKRTLFFLLAIAAIGYFGYRYYNKPHKDVASVKPDFELSADDLLKAFEADEASANTKFLDKIIKVNGVIKSIEKNDQGGKTLTLATENDMSSVRCELLPDEKTDNLQVGDAVSVAGFCSGYLMDVVLDRCRLTGS